ncbi:hypothetical protein AMATHDRAFT_74222 [Amanita thiersii Skay4041]|uniref:Prokaryotic-type class I peptide chain release factors domain-containing protein n=1 Tax=Amanita thiersii Skay4041 TaxID=703135 RepID=A0A2A9NX93_9AGAR|nr:hypothetical protein AMATHDRAFT_74222 [Amanita thiersii Skay4041]
MSISTQLQASARSAYRQLYRAASSTFHGDEPVLTAFRLKMRQDAMGDQSIIDPILYQEREQLARQIAEVLRKNIVQGIKVTGDTGADTSTWRLQFRDETEFGSNDSIKTFADDSLSSRSARKRETNNTLPIQNNSPVPTYYSALKKAHKQRRVPVLREEDLEESFVRGGGQSINKTENNVQLLHKPTGIRVSCQETRSLALNRRRARKWLLEKLDQLENPGLSKNDLERAKQRERERRRRKKAKKRSLLSKVGEEPA